MFYSPFEEPDFLISSSTLQAVLNITKLDGLRNNELNGTSMDMKMPCMLLENHSYEDVYLHSV